MKSILKKLDDVTARIQRTILIAGAISSSDVFSDDLDEFFDDEDETDIEKCLGKIPEYVDLEAKSYERCDAIYEWLRESGKLGFLVQFATPVMTPCGKDSRSYSWGYYNTTWIYAETIDEAIEKGLAWVSERRRYEDMRKKKKGGAA